MTTLTINETITTRAQRDDLIARLQDFTPNPFVPGLRFKAYGEEYVVLDPAYVSDSIREELTKAQSYGGADVHGIVLEVTSRHGRITRPQVFYWDPVAFKVIEEV